MIFCLIRSSQAPAGLGVCVSIIQVHFLSPLYCALSRKGTESTQAYLRHFFSLLTMNTVARNSKAERLSVSNSFSARYSIHNTDKPKLYDTLLYLALRWHIYLGMTNKNLFLRSFTHFSFFPIMTIFDACHTSS